MVPFQRVSSSKRRAAMGSPTSMHFRVRENSEKQRAASLLFRPPVARKPRISTGNERPLAVNFRPEQLAKSSWDACVALEALGGGIEAKLDRKGCYNLNKKSRCRFAADCRSSSFDSISDCSPGKRQVGAKQERAGWRNGVRRSRRPLRDLLTMRSFLNPIKGCPSC